MWQTSIAPTICGIPYSSSNSSTSSCYSCLASGNSINWAFSRKRQSSNSKQIVLALDIPIPNCSPQFLKLSPVASLHIATATLKFFHANRWTHSCLLLQEVSPNQIAQSLESRTSARKWTFQSVSMSRLVKSTLNQFCGRSQAQALWRFFLPKSALIMNQSREILG